MTDVHANLPALEATLQVVRREGYDAIFHTGDAIAIGPYPAECLDLLLHTPNIHFVKGNHEAWLVDGLPKPQPSWMSDGEVKHQRWTHAQIDPQLRSAVGKWPYVLAHDFQGVKMTFLHYALAESSSGFVPLVNPPTAAGLDRIFGQHDSQLIFYGHDHRSSDLQGRARYVNPGSLGCYDKAVARYAVVLCEKGQFLIEHRQVPYDDAELWQAFERRRVPERAFIYRAFFGGRSPG